ncbi:mannonate dehydratase [Flavobacterium gilvum]|uniref:mannonate dehydratase n=1 Tax=Flavobacterium gilvum TaxID=1492737 RepID=A0AAC9I813_9FLAO|nr:mannonate dehydratase [Flavobacterium gilvum]AOW10598.1 D-mannonate dehydratase [Flavobacterium gilvum]KFC57849.1 D-mannonate dehydratase [Flavobacterium gilvum]
MKLGLGLYHHMLNKEHYAFAKQCGCTHVVIHLVDYFNKGNQGNKNDQPIGDGSGWGIAGKSKNLWEVDELLRIKKEINDAGLEWGAIENFDPADWHDILLDGPKKKQQIEEIKRLIRNVGKAGIPVIGYNFSLAGVCSRTTGPFARGGANSVGMDGVDERPIPNGMVWNMVYDENAPNGVIPNVSHEILWQRLEYFLNEIIPVAEEAGVVLAAHPDDPPMPVVRNTPRLVYQPSMYKKLLDINPSKNNALEFCLGSIAEMTEGDVYEATETYADTIAYIHFRNVKGKVPFYKEVFVDEGDIDMIKILRILKEKKFEGILIPDHTPQMTCEGSWYAGMAYALGYMKAAMKLI